MPGRVHHNECSASSCQMSFFSRDLAHTSPTYLANHQSWKSRTPPPTPLELERSPIYLRHVGRKHHGDVARVHLVVALLLDDVSHEVHRPVQQRVVGVRQLPHERHHLALLLRGRHLFRRQRVQDARRQLAEPRLVTKQENGVRN